MTQVIENAVNENENTVGEAVEADKPKRGGSRRTKVQKTGAQVAAEINKLKEEVDELKTAYSMTATDNIVYKIVKEAFEVKQAELEKALDTIHFS